MKLSEMPLAEQREFISESMMQMIEAEQAQLDENAKKLIAEIEGIINGAAGA